MKKLLIALLIYSGVVNAQLTQRSTPPLSVTLNNTFFQDTVNINDFDTISVLNGNTYLTPIITKYPFLAIDTFAGDTVSIGINPNLFGGAVPFNGATLIKDDTVFISGVSSVLGGLSLIGRIDPSGTLKGVRFGSEQIVMDVTGDAIISPNDFTVNASGEVIMEAAGDITTTSDKYNVGATDSLTLTSGTASTLTAGNNAIVIDSSGNITVFAGNNIRFAKGDLSPQSTGFYTMRVDSVGNLVTFNTDSVIENLQDSITALRSAVEASEYAPVDYITLTYSGVTDTCPGTCTLDLGDLDIDTTYTNYSSFTTLGDSLNLVNSGVYQLVVTTSTTIVIDGTQNDAIRLVMLEYGGVEQKRVSLPFMDDGTAETSTIIHSISANKKYRFQLQANESFSYVSLTIKLYRL